MPQGTISEGTGRFLGLNLRVDRQDLGSDQLGKTVNADLHKFVGVVSLRNGRDELQSALSAAVRSVARVNSVRYQVAGTALYRAGSAVQDYRATALDSSSLYTTVIPFKPVDDNTIWAFVADRAVMQKDDGTNTRQWGIAAIGDVQARDDSTSTYTYSLGVTQIRFQGSTGTTVAFESNPTSVSISE